MAASGGTPLSASPSLTSVGSAGSPTITISGTNRKSAEPNSCIFNDKRERERERRREGWEGVERSERVERNVDEKRVAGFLLTLL